jgi:hypothetical protein
MKFSTLLLIICFLVIPLTVSAANETVIGISENFTITAANTNATKLLSEEFYGTVLYSDNSPVPSRSEIIAKNQQGKTIGNFTMTFNGSYGDSYASASRLIVRTDNADDMITFYINTIKSTTPPRQFDSGSIKRADIIIDISAKSLLSQTIEPISIPTQEPAVNLSIEPTSVPTQEPTPAPTKSGKSVVVITGDVTFPPTPVQPTMTFPVPLPTTPTPTPKPTTTPTPSGLDDTTIKFLGVLLVGIGICVVGAIITYYILTKKMKRDDDEEIIL